MTNASVLLPGSYDPPTEGHLEIIRRCASLFSKLHVVIFVNPTKTYLFTEEERLLLLKAACKSLGDDLAARIVLDIDNGMVVDYVKRHNISMIVKGVRDEKDFLYEKAMAEYNRLHGDVETLLLPAAPETCAISSTLLRQALIEGTSLSGLVVAEEETLLRKLYKEKQAKI